MSMYDNRPVNYLFNVVDAASDEVIMIPCLMKGLDANPARVPGVRSLAPVPEARYF